MTVNQNSADGLSRRKILKYGLCGSLAVPLAPVLWLSGCARSQRTKGQNIILVVVDTLRPDHLGCYGYSRNTSPNIDQFATDSLLFENCFAHAPSTSASVASILSGFLPHETKVTNKTVMSKQLRTLPLLLRPHGYKTSAVVSNYVFREIRGWDNGFDKYDAEMKDHELNRKNIIERLAKHTTDRAIKVLKKFRKDNLFMWIHYQDPHGPYTPPAAFAKLFKNTADKPRLLKLNNIGSGRRGIPHYQKLGANRDFHHYLSQYDSEIRYADEHIKRLFDTLKRLELYSDSLIIFTADHGEGMGEHDYYFAHGEYLYNTLTHVPLIIKCPAKSTGRKTDFVQHIDIVPTILKYSHIDPDPRLRGCDLRTEIPVGREIFAKMETAMVRDNFKYSILADGFKLIHTPLYDRYELYNMTEDFNEELDLVNDPHHRTRTEDLKIRLKRIRKQDLLQLGTIKSPKLTDEELEKLKSLGYVK
ncbi:MAG: sulfatase [Planctomycetota bacterium]|jgi:arylsulfatase